MSSKVSHFRADKEGERAIDHWNFFKRTYLPPPNPTAHDLIQELPAAGSAPGFPGGPPLYQPMPAELLALLANNKIEEICAQISAKLKLALGDITQQGNLLVVETVVTHVDIIIALFPNYLLKGVGMDSIALLSRETRKYRSTIPTAEWWPDWLKLWPSRGLPLERRSRYGAVIRLIQETIVLSISRLQLEDCDHSQCPRCLWKDTDGVAAVCKWM